MDLAKAIGKTVGNTLLGKSEIKLIISSEHVKETFVNGVMKIVDERITDDTTTKSLLSEIMGKEKYSQKKEELSVKVSNRIAQGLVSMDIGKIITDRGVEVIKQKLSNPMLSFLVNEKAIKSISSPIGVQINEYIQKDGIDMIESFLIKEVTELESKSINSLVDNKEDILAKIRQKLGDIYINFINKNIESFVKQFKISEIVEEKISNMDNETLEMLALSVMKNELGVVVKLGAVIGFIIGIFNTFI